MAEKIFLKVDVDGHHLVGVLSVSISQGIFEHHSFEVVVPGVSVIKDPEKSELIFDKVAGWIGKGITIDWEAGLTKKESQGTECSVFKGIVMHVGVSGNRKEHMRVSITGKSPTILLDGVPNSGTYADKKLNEIYDLAKANSAGEELGAEEHLGFTDPIAFAVQYNETDFNFLCRLMHENGEWFYYDGQKVHLGVIEENEVVLPSHRVSSLDFSFSASKPVPQVRAWDYLANAKLVIKAADPQQSDKHASNISKASDTLYPSHGTNSLPFPSYPDGDEFQTDKDALKTKLDKARQGRSNEVFTLLGSSDLAEMQVGHILKLDGFAYGGKYIVTRVTHSCSGRDSYQNYFQAVPVDAGIPSSVSVQYPRIESCVAKVTDNKDPKKLGRVRVKFEWGEEPTPWLRVVWPHAGKDRGFYFVPEVEDEVMVGFEMGQESFPYVMGSLYNGQNAQEGQYEQDDKLKVIRTKSGNEILFDDDGRLFVRNDKNSMELSCSDDGVLTIQTKGDMILKADKNITIEAGETVGIAAGTTMTVEAGKDMEVTAGTEFSLSAGTESSLSSGTKTNVAAGTDLTLEGTVNTKVTGAMVKVEGSTTTDVSAGGVTQVKGAMVKIN